MSQEHFATQTGSFSAEVTRRAIFAQYARTAANSPGILAGGLVAAGDLALSAPGSGMSVNVAAGEAIVGGTSGGAQGGYYGRNTASLNLSVTASNPTNPRVDTVVATVADALYGQPSDVGGTTNGLVLAVVTGTPTSGATLTNLSGAPSLPLSSLLLGYILVPATSTNVTAGNISNVASPWAVQNSLTVPRVTMTAQTRALGTAYQPNTLRPTLVLVTFAFTGTSGTNEAQVLMDSANPPTTNIAAATTNVSASAVKQSSTFIVPPSFYYKFTAAVGTPTIQSTYEYAL